MIKKLIPTLAVIALSALNITPLCAAAPLKKVLVVTATTGFRHSSIATAEKVLAQLAEQSGAFTVDYVHQPEGKPGGLKNDATDKEKADFKAAEHQWQEKLKHALQKLSPESLKHYDGVIFANTTGDLPIPDKEGFLNWIKAGGAFIGMHSCGDTYHGWPEFIDMLGAEFQTHGAQVGVECLNMDPTHPATQKLGRSWVISQEEMYRFKNYDATKVHDLLSLDKHPNDKTPGHYPVSWCKEYGSHKSKPPQHLAELLMRKHWGQDGGRVFYTSLGHREDIWDADPNMKDRKNSREISFAYQAHILGGIKWALGLEQSKAK